MNQLKRIWIWCKRIRHLNGFGVQSPFAFNFIHTVIYRQLPKDVKKQIRIHRKNSPYRISHPLPERVERLLYKLIEYTSPTLIIYIENEFTGGIHSVTTACQCPCLGFVGSTPEPSGKKTGVSHENLRLSFGNIEGELQDSLRKHSSIDFAYIDLKTRNAEILCYELLNRCRPSSLMVLGNIHISKQNKSLWRQLADNQVVALTFDLYSVGILLFDHHYQRQHYVINFE